MRASLLALLLASASTLFAGCAIQSEVADDEGTVSDSEDALGTTQLYGTWNAESGPIYTITFDKAYAETLGGGLKGKAFSATVDNGVRCITTPCPSTDEVGGVYKLRNGSRLTLASYDKPSLVFSQYLGDYRITLKGDLLTLKKTDGTVAGTLRKQATTAGEKCGTVTCGAGTTCCNPLMGICVKPGMMCIL
ncbi:MAG: hypothetical protein HYV09_12895 [Deltaproteobacteria bacterium]|nr:hypothetical protein [Deltaproteobacteria bacterium]